MRVKQLVLQTTLVLAAMSFLTFAPALAQQDNAATTVDANTDAKPPVGAETVNECVKQYYTALVNGDQDAMRRVSLWRSKLDKRASEALFRFGGAADRFRSKFIAAYGDNAWQKFNDPKHLPYAAGAPQGANGKITILGRHLVAELADTVAMNSDQRFAQVAIPDSDRKLTMVQRDGLWFVLGETLLAEEDPEKIKSAANLMGRLAVELERLSLLIGKPGITPDDLDFQFGLESLLAMELVEPGNITPRIDTSKLQQPVPFKVIEDVSELLTVDSATASFYFANAEGIVRAFLHERPELYVQHLSPPLRPYVDQAEILALGRRVKLALNITEEVKPRVVHADFEYGGCRVEMILPGTEPQAVIEVFGVGDQWAGLTVSSEHFGVDTRNATCETVDLEKRHAEFMSLVLSGNIQESFRIFYPNLEPEGEKFEDFSSQLPTEIQWVENLPLVARLLPSPAVPCIQVLSVARIERAGKPDRIRCMTRYGFIEGNWMLREFQFGDIEEPRYFMNDFTIQESLFKALGEGNAEAIVAMVSEKNRTAIHKTIFAAYCKKFHEIYGEFESIDRTRYRVEVQLNSPDVDTQATGFVQFRKGRLESKMSHDRLGLISLFPALDDDSQLLQFRDGITDLTEHQTFAERFIRLYLSTEAEPSQEIVDMLGNFDELDRILRERQELTRDNGPVQSIRIDSNQYSKESGTWEFQFSTDCQNRKVDATVVLSCDLFQVAIEGFKFESRE